MNLLSQFFCSAVVTKNCFAHCQSRCNVTFYTARMLVSPCGEGKSVIYVNIVQHAFCDINSICVETRVSCSAWCRSLEPAQSPSHCCAQYAVAFAQHNSCLYFIWHPNLCHVYNNVKDVVLKQCCHHAVVGNLHQFEITVPYRSKRVFLLISAITAPQGGFATEGDVNV